MTQLEDPAAGAALDGSTTGAEEVAPAPAASSEVTAGVEGGVEAPAGGEKAVDAGAVIDPIAVVAENTETAAVAEDIAVEGDTAIVEPAAAVTEPAAVAEPAAENATVSDNAAVSDTTAITGEKSEEAKSTDEKIEVKEHRHNPRGKNKFDPTLLPESDDPAEIRHQVEFYFSDSNLPFDKFLFGIVTKENKYVPVKIICKFKRMLRFPNRETVVSALRESEILEMEGEQGNERIRRKVPLALATNKPPSNGKASSKEDEPKPSAVVIHDITDRARVRSLYAKGFGEETATSQVDLEEFFKPYGPLRAVRLRREDSGLFKGSVFIEFDNSELLDKFMKLDPKPIWKGQDLEWKTKEEYVAQKIEDIKSGKIKPNWKPQHRNFSAFKEKRGSSGAARGSGGSGGRGGGRGGRGGANRGGGGGRGSARGGRGGRGGGGNWKEGGARKSANRPVDERDLGIPIVRSTVDVESEKKGTKRKSPEGDHEKTSTPKAQKVE